MYVIYDSTFDGLLSAAAYCFRHDFKPQGIISDADEQPIVESVQIPREANIRRIFLSHLGKLCGDDAGTVILDTAFRAYLSELPFIADQICHYLRRSLEIGADPSPRLFEPPVAAVVEAARKVSGQAHKYLGLLRFREIFTSFFLADFKPDYHILPLVLPHFSDRLSDQCFAIRDLKRKIAAFHPPGGPVSIRILSDVNIPEAGALPIESSRPVDHAHALHAGAIEEKIRSSGSIEDTCEVMWRGYLKYLSIPERVNPALQQANMPKKYWKYLTENPRDQSGA